ncbi:MAG: response regulator transcription factor [Elusimicrobia bacterium]|nr:response regulator transcription factor [Elusimicrobiota bacterium]
MIIDDDREHLKLARIILDSAGYSVIEAENGETAIRYATEKKPDLVILDWILPDIPGIEVCKILRSDIRTRYIPIIMLTAKTKIDDEVKGLEIGADEYLKKPCRKDELLAYVKAVLRRVEYAAGNKDEIIKKGDIQLFPDKRRVVLGGDEIKLNKKEYDLFYLLFKKPGRVLSREYLFETVWGWDSQSMTGTLDTYICTLRKKIGKNGGKIVAVKGVGYKFET